MRRTLFGGFRCWRSSLTLSQHTHNLPRRSIQTASTVHHDRLEDALILAIQNASAPHYGFTSNDMPSQALILVSQQYFPSKVSDLAKFLHDTVTKAIGDDTIQVIGGIVDDIPLDQVQGSPGVSLLLVSEDEQASVHVFEDSTDRTISVGRAWKDQGTSTEDTGTNTAWLSPEGIKDLFSGTSQYGFKSSITSQHNIKDAIVLAKGEFSSIDWPSQMFPNATISGMLPAITPFLTGHPMTLCYNGETVTSGGVALAFPRAQFTRTIRRPRLKILGSMITITK
jgi:hypothetical protein